MIHAHKEILIRDNGVERWEHLDALHLKGFDVAHVAKFCENCFSDTSDHVTIVTKLDGAFTLPNSVQVIRNIPDAKTVWDHMMNVPFDSVFGCWPWDYADALDDGPTKLSMEEYGILDARLVLFL